MVTDYLPVNVQSSAALFWRQGM